MTTTAPTTPPIEDTFRRIRNILDVCPAEDWTPEDAREVLAALESIVFRRNRLNPTRDNQKGSHLECDPRSARPSGSPGGGPNPYPVGSNERKFAVSRATQMSCGTGLAMDVNDFMYAPHDPCFTTSEMDQMLVYNGTRKERKAAKARIKEREQGRAERLKAQRPQDSEPQELQHSQATELGILSGRVRRIIRWRSATGAGTATRRI
jgi:hypothetical protein